MAKVNIKKLSVIALQQDRDEVLSLLQNLGCAEVIDLGESDEELSAFEGSPGEFRERLNDLEFTIDFISRYEDVSRSIFDPKPVYSDEEIEEMARSQTVAETIDRARELEQKLGDLKRVEMKQQTMIEALEPWNKLEVPVEDLGTTEFASFRVGTVPETSFTDFKEAVSGLGAAHIEQVGSATEDTYVFLAYHRDLEAEIRELQGDYGWASQELPEVQGTPAEALAAARDRLEEAEQEKQEIVQEIRELADNYHLVEVAYDYYSILFERATAADKFSRTEQVFNLQAWVPETDMEEVERVLEANIDGIFIDFDEPEEDEDIPTVVDNPRVVEPFELITDLYSPPGKNDIDPNLTMAPFFFLSFGMMISDAGYGIVLMILSYLGLKKIRPEGQGKKLFELIFWGGLATFIWGVIYGGWFGELIGLPALWIRPLNDPISILILSFVIGGIQIFAGLGLQAYKKIKNDRVMAAIFDEGFWMIFLIGFVLFVFPRTAPFAHYVVIAGAVLLVLTQGRERKNPIVKVGAGLLSLYDVTTYLSDVLSYSRIMALGLATGVIATVVNTMGDLIAVNIVGYIAMIVVMLVGHLFNIAVNSLGAYVHTSRLQYVEFFSKFYEGGGRSLDPLAIKTNYIKYKQGEEKI